MQSIPSFLLVALWAWCAVSLTAQNAPTLTHEDFIQQVRAYHPVMRQAALLLERGEQEIRYAKGAFDPELYTYFDQKSFGGKDYYRNLSAGVKVPTRLGGASFKAGYDRFQGEYVNPETGTPTNGLLYAGVSMPLLQGLLIDERRAALQQADIFASMTLVEQRKMTNDLLNEATNAYWEWATYSNELSVYEEAVVLAKTRLEAIKVTYEQGDKPAIDTLEAFIQWQDRQVKRSQAFVKWQKKSAELALFLWDGNGEPLALAPDVRAPYPASAPVLPLTGDSLELAVNALPLVHPDLLLYDLMLQDLAVQRRWKREKLKPKLEVNYNVLLEPATSEPSADLSPNNFKWGVTFKAPIPMRTARADLQLNAIKQQETELKRDQKAWSLENKARFFYTELQSLRDQIALSENNVDNYSRLLDAERKRFDIGESSLFLVNSRENKLIDAQLKLISLRTQYAATTTALRWSLGQLR